MQNVDITILQHNQIIWGFNKYHIVSRKEIGYIFDGVDLNLIYSLTGFLKAKYIPNAQKTINIL